MHLLGYLAIAIVRVLAMGYVAVVVLDVLSSTTRIVRAGASPWMRMSASPGKATLDLANGVDYGEVAQVAGYILTQLDGAPDFDTTSTSVRFLRTIRPSTYLPKRSLAAEYRDSEHALRAREILKEHFKKMGRVITDDEITDSIRRIDAEYQRLQTEQE